MIDYVISLPFYVSSIVVFPLLCSMKSCPPSNLRAELLLPSFESTTSISVWSSSQLFSLKALDIVFFGLCSGYNIVGYFSSTSKSITKTQSLLCQAANFILQIGSHLPCTSTFRLVMIHCTLACMRRGRII